MYSNGNARSAISQHARDSSSMPPDHTPSALWERAAFTRDNFERPERDKHASAKNDWAMDNRPSSTRSSNAAFPNPSYAPPPAKRRALGRHGPSHENGRFGSTTGCPSDMAVHSWSPSENGKVERDFSGGPSPGYSSSPSTGKTSKDSDGHHFRGLSPCETRPASSPSFDPPSRLCGKQIGLDGTGSRERERSKFGALPQVRDTSFRERDYRERGWSRPEYHRRTFSLPKLDSPRDWNGGDRELLEGRIDRYGSASSRDPAFSDVLNVTSKEHYRYDWRNRERSLFCGFSSSSLATPSKDQLLANGAASTHPEVDRASSPPKRAASQRLASHESQHDDDAGAPKKRPRLTWGQGLAKYEKEKVEDDPSALKRLEGSHSGTEERSEDIHANQALQNVDVFPCPKNFSEVAERPGDSGGNQGMQVEWSSEVARDFVVLSPQLAEAAINEDLKDPSMVDDTFQRPPVALVPACADLQDGQASGESALSEEQKSKEVLMQDVEKVDVEMECLERELMGLGDGPCTHESLSWKEDEIHLQEQIVSTHEPISLKEDEVCLKEQVVITHDVLDSNVLLPGAKGSKSFDNNSVVQLQHSDCVSTSTLAVLCTESLVSPLHDASVQVQEVHAQEPLEEVEVKGHEEKIDIDFEAPDQAVVAMDGLIENTMLSVRQTGEAQLKVNQRDGRLPALIILANQRIANQTLKSLSHLNSPEMGKIMECGRLYGSPQEATIWKLNEESHTRKRKLIESEIVEEKALRRFTEVALLAKRRALEETRKQKQSDSHSKVDYERTPKVSEKFRRDDSNLIVEQLLLHGCLITGGKNEDCQEARQLNGFCIGKERGFLRMPSMHLGKREREQHKFETKNGLVEDPVSAEKERKACNPWSKEEKKLFLDKYFLFGKDFRRIASHLEHKTVADCVEFYYRNQKAEEFEKVQRRHQLMKGKDYLPSAPYLTTGTLFSRQQSEGNVNIAGLEGLTLVAAAAAAMSTPKKLSIVPPWVGSAIAGETKPYSRVLITEGSNEERRGSKGTRSTHTRPKAYKEEIDQQWNEREKKAYLNAVVMFGKNFYSISQHVGTKTERQCKTFFSKARKELALDQLVERHNVILQASTAENEIATPLIRDMKGKPDTCVEGSPSQDQCMPDQSASPAVALYEHTKSHHELLEKDCQHDITTGTSVSNLVQEVDHAEDFLRERSVSKCVPCVSNVIKQEGYTLSDDGGKSAGDGDIGMGTNCEVNGAPLVEPSQGCSLEESLVCGEVLHFKTEALSVKVESALAGNNAKPVCNGILSHIHTMSPPLVSVLVPKSVPVSHMIQSAQVKDQSMKTEAKARREPTSWTQDEKDKFAEVLKVYGKSWDRLRENLPGKSLTQIKTYFQNSKAKLGFGVENANGRAGLSRKKKAEDSDSSSNAGSGGPNTLQMVPMFADDGSLKVGPSMFVPPGGVGSHGHAGDALMYANYLSRNSLEDPQKAFHSLGLTPNTSSASISPLLNPAVFTSPNLRASQQSVVHGNVAKAQQVVGLQQPHQAASPFGVVAPLQQSIVSVGIHQMHQPRQPSPPQPAGCLLQELALPSVQQLHKQPALLQSEVNQKALFQQQQQQVVQQVSDAVLQQQLSPQLLHRQQQMLAPVVGHHSFQQVLSQHLAHPNQQAPNQLPLGSSQPACPQIASVSQSTSANQQLHQQPDLLQPQLFQMHTKPPALLQQLQQTHQLQRLHLHWQQQQAQVHQAQANKQAQNPGSNLQPSNFTLLNQQQQPLSVLRGIVKATSACTEPVKQPDGDLKSHQGVHEGLQPLPLVSQGTLELINSENLRAGDIKLFGQSLLSQPVASKQHSTVKVSSPSPQVASSTLPSSSIAGKNSGNAAFQLPPDACLRASAWQTAWPATHIVSNGLCNVLASSSTPVSSQSAHSGLHDVLEGASCMSDSFIREARCLEAGVLSEGMARALSTVSLDCANQHFDSQKHENLTGSDNDIPVSKSREEECSQAPSMAGRHAASQGLPRVLDALVALAEWRLQNVNGGSGRLTDEFLSQSWEALQNDPGSLVEASKAGGSLAQMCMGTGETLQHLKGNLSSCSGSSGGGAMRAGSSGQSPLSNAPSILVQSPSLLRHNGEVGILEVRDVDGREGGGAG